MPAQRTRTPAGKVMLVEVGCGRTGGIQNHDTMRTEFQGNRLMDWADERIPDSFKARVWPNPGLDKGTKRDVGGVSGVTGPAKKQKT